MKVDIGFVTLWPHLEFTFRVLDFPIHVAVVDSYETGLCISGTNHLQCQRELSVPHSQRYIAQPLENNVFSRRLDIID